MFRRRWGEEERSRRRDRSDGEIERERAESR